MLGMHSLDSARQTRDLLLPSTSLPRDQGPALAPQTLPQEQQELRLYPHLHASNLYALKITLCYKNATLNSQGSPCSFLFPHHYHCISLPLQPDTEQLKLLQRNSKGPENLWWGCFCDHLQTQSSQASPSPGETQPCIATQLSRGECKSPLHKLLAGKMGPTKIQHP